MDAEAAPLEAMMLGDVRIEPAYNRLSRAGRQVQLEPKVMRLLLCLAARPGEVVRQAEIRAAIWGPVHVVDGVLARAAYRLRQALAEAGGDRLSLETIRGNGYRLNERIAAARPLRRPSTFARGLRSPLAGWSAACCLTLALLAAWPVDRGLDPAAYVASIPPANPGAEVPISAAHARVLPTASRAMPVSGRRPHPIADEAPLRVAEAKPDLPKPDAAVARTDLIAPPAPAAQAGLAIPLPAPAAARRLALAQAVRQPIRIRAAAPDEASDGLPAPRAPDRRP